MNPGEKYNRLTAVALVEQKRNGARWLFRCNCGTEKVLQAAGVRRGVTKSCGCYRREMKAAHLEGQRFTRLTVLCRSGSNKKQSAVWRCRCDCGAEVMVTSHDLRSGHYVSCGCYRAEVLASQFTHGDSESREYKIWAGMLKRCARHINYAGRGIEVCERWRSYEHFLSDMGRAPSNRHSIDRIDNDGHYEPSNCRWATRQEQSLNTRRTVRIEVAGELLPLTVAARRFGKSPGLVRDRINLLGWDVATALALPAGVRRG